MKRREITLSVREILLALTDASRIRGGPSPKISLSKGLNYTNRHKNSL